MKILCVIGLQPSERPGKKKVLWLPLLILSLLTEVDFIGPIVAAITLATPTFIKHCAENIVAVAPVSTLGTLWARHCHPCFLTDEKVGSLGTWFTS